MAYVFTGTKRSLTITITKTLEGSIVQGYPVTYYGQQGGWHPSYSAITDTQLARLSDEQYLARLTAFRAYVKSIESGYNPAKDEANNPYLEDLGTCPTPPTTTTTTEAATTTTTEAAATTTTESPATTTTTAAPATTTTTTT